MTLTGTNLVAGTALPSPAGRFSSPGGSTSFEQATLEHVDAALAAADTAFTDYRTMPGHRRAELLEQIAVEIEALGDDLLAAAHSEAALPIAARLVGERARTVGQLRLFAAMAREGSWVDARIDRAMPDRTPPRPDIRRMLIPIGPVAVFSASNFPLAFSVAGTDTAAALAAGCPVIVKGHPAHPATSELTARAVVAAIEKTGHSPGLFSLLQSTRNEIAVALVQHPSTRAVAFTGSLTAGRALFDAGASRREPIPVYAEMGSVNPVFVLPGALDERAEAIAQGLLQSVTLGVGQFCTCPGVVAGVDGPGLDRFAARLADLVGAAQPGTMLYPRIRQSFETGWRALSSIDGVRTIQTPAAPDVDAALARATVLVTDARTFLANEGLRHEVFGPSTVLVRCESPSRLEEVARSLDGQLTATLHGTTADLAEYASLVAILQGKAGRLVFNGFPTGVEVCPSMQHGGPYPATTDARSTSVGTAAILRFARPLAYQGFPEASLPLELQDGNPARIWRLVDGELSRDGF